ncbi:hypothetical protein V8F06_002486 [Rhypophila decipiens]
MERTTFPKRSQFYIDEYTFEEKVRRPKDIKYEELSQEELADVCRELRKKVEKYERAAEDELEQKLRLARALTVLEMHMNIPDEERHGHHQNVSLEHAITWLGKYGYENGEGLLIDVNEIQRKVISKRVREVMRTSQLCNTRPCCKHVLQARPPVVQEGENLQYSQIALGLPVQQFLETLPPDVLASDSRIWRRTDGTLHHFAKQDDRLSRDKIDKMGFLTLYFRGQTTPEFITTQRTVIDNLQREAHRKKELKVCKEVAQSGMRRTVNVIRKAMGDEDYETVSPTKSVMSSMAVAPRPYKPGSKDLPRHKHVSMVKLYENPEGGAAPLMTGALNRGSKKLSTAAANADRYKRQRTSAGSQKAVSFQTANLEQIRENARLSPEPRAPPPPPKRERVHRESRGSRESGEAAKKEKSVPSWAAGTSSSQARKATTGSVGSSSRQRTESPARPAGRRAQSPLVPATRNKTPDSTRKLTKSAASSSTASPVTHRLHPTSRITPSTGKTQKSTPGTTPQVDRARSSSKGSSKLSSHMTQWPGPGAPAPDKGKAREDKGKGKAKDVGPDAPPHNPYLSKSPAGLPADWKRPPSEFYSDKSSSKHSQPTPTPAPRPASSVYSAYPPAPADKKRGVAHRNREAREHLTLSEEPEPVETPPRKRPSSQQTIPEGVDLGNVAGGLGHGFNPTHLRQGSTSTLGTIPPGLDLDTASGTASRYVPPRKAWDASKNPKAYERPQSGRKRYHFPAGALGPMLERTPPLGGWGSDENTENEEEERSEPRSFAERMEDRKKPLPPTGLLGQKSNPSLTQSDKKSGATVRNVSSAGVEVFHPNPKVNRFAEAQTAILEGGDDDDDEWSSRIGLPTTPGASVLPPAARSFHSPTKLKHSPTKLKRGRNNLPRGSDKLAVPRERRAHGSRSPSSGADDHHREPSPIAEDGAAGSAPAPVSPLSPGHGNKFRDHIDSILTEYGDERDFTVRSPTPRPVAKNPVPHLERQQPGSRVSFVPESTMDTRPFPPKNWALNPKPESSSSSSRKKGKEVARKEEDEEEYKPEAFHPDDPPERQEEWRARRQKTNDRKERERPETLRKLIEEENREQEEEKREQEEEKKERRR